MILMVMSLQYVDQAYGPGAFAAVKQVQETTSAESTTLPLATVAWKMRKPLLCGLIHPMIRVHWDCDSELSFVGASAVGRKCPAFKGGIVYLGDVQCDT